MANVIFSIYLIWVSLQDYREMQVVRYSHGLGIAAILLEILRIVFLQDGSDIYKVWEYMWAGVILLLLQMAAYLFKLYGVADMFVFLLCGMFLLFQKGTGCYLTMYFMIHAVSGILLLVVQFIKGNVKGANLRQPVPYIPYISIAFFLTNMVL